MIFKLGQTAGFRTQRVGDGPQTRDVAEMAPCHSLASFVIPVTVRACTLSARSRFSSRLESIPFHIR